jgi:hypothetical protein
MVLSDVGESGRASGRCIGGIRCIDRESARQAALTWYAQMRLGWLCRIHTTVLKSYVCTCRPRPDRVLVSCCQIRHGSYAEWLISSWWCAPPYIFIYCSIVPSCFLTICNIINYVITVPLYRCKLFTPCICFPMRINLTVAIRMGTPFKTGHFRKRKAAPKSPCFQNYVS